MLSASSAFLKICLSLIVTSRRLCRCPLDLLQSRSNSAGSRRTMEAPQRSRQCTGAHPSVISQVIYYRGVQGCGVRGRGNLTRGKVGVAGGAAFSEGSCFQVPDPSRFAGRVGVLAPSSICSFMRSQLSFQRSLTPDRLPQVPLTKLLTSWYSCDTRIRVVRSP